MPTPIASWSNVCPATTTLADFSEAEWTRGLRSGAVIPRGAGRSFGDAAYVSEGTTLCSTRLLDFGPIEPDEVEPDRATIRVGAGVAVGELHRHVNDAGFRFPIYGGTQWATVGGAIGSDIHGKNHASAGSFGEHVVALELLTARGERLICSRSADQHPELFAATLGGMGMTGFILTATLALRRGRPGAVATRWRTVAGFEAMLDAFEADRAAYRFCSFVDLSRHAPRGLYCSATLLDSSRPLDPHLERFGRTLALPLPRVRVLGAPVVRVFDHLLHGVGRPRDGVTHERNFNFSGVHETLFHWNRLFGPRGFIEYQFALPRDPFVQVLEHACAGARERGLCLRFAVVKRFGEREASGLLSFPSPGYTINFQVEDDANARALLDRVTARVVEARGRLYLAKDAVASAAQFEGMYPDIDRWREVVATHDPHAKIASNLSRRLGLKQHA